MNTPLFARIVQSRLHADVQALSLLESLVELEFADLTSHGCLGEKRERSDRLVDHVGCLVCVLNLEVQDAVDLDLDVVPCDCALLVNC